MNIYDELVDEVNKHYSEFKNLKPEDFQEIDTYMESRIMKAYCRDHISEEQYEELIIMRGRFLYGF